MSSNAKAASASTAKRTEIPRNTTRAAHASVVGDGALKGKLLGAGPILHAIDALASEVSFRICLTRFVTVMFDTVRMLSPIFHGDLVRLEGRALSIKNSSMMCQVSAYRYDADTSRFKLAYNAVATFVSVTDAGVPISGLPRLVDHAHPEEADILQRTAAQRRELGRRWRKSQEEVIKLTKITHDMIPLSAYHSKAKTRMVNIQDTITETRYPFLLKDSNHERYVFGGVLLEYMDKTALVCAQIFTKNNAMVSISMNRVHFKLPIRLTDVIDVRTRICCVKKYSVEVEVAVYRFDGYEDQLSHTGYVEVLNLENLEAPWQAKPVLLDVTAEESDLDGMQSLLKAHRRKLFEKEDAELLAMAPVPLSFSKWFTTQPSKL